MTPFEEVMIWRKKRAQYARMVAMENARLEARKQAARKERGRAAPAPFNFYGASCSVGSAGLVRKK